MESESSHLLFLIIVGTVAMLFLAGAVIFFVQHNQKRILQSKLEIQNLETDYQRRLLTTTINSQEKERTRVGQELHDSVGAMLSTIKLNLKMAEKDPSILSEISAELTSHLDETIETVRSISRDLHPAGLTKFGLAGVVKELVERVNKTGQIAVHFDENAQSIRLSDQLELIIYRIVQESLNNAIKHSRAHNIWLYFKWSLHELHVNVKDDGVGFSTDQLNREKRGLGLYNIANRAEIINASVNFSNLATGGANIHLAIPISSDETQED